MSTSDNIRIEPGTGRILTQVKQVGGTTSPSDISGRGTSSSVASADQDILNQLQIGTLGGGASLYGRREANTFFFRGLETENGLTVRTTPTSVVLGLENGAGGGGGDLPDPTGNEGLFLRVNSTGDGFEYSAAGATGPEGPAGADGAPGATGPAGPKGDQGESLKIDQVAPTLVELEDGITVGEVGYVTTEQHIYIWDGANWVDGGEISAIQGPPGEDGAPGADGAQGPKGDQGDVGPAGPKGDQGDVGPQGPAGSGGGASRFVDLTDVPPLAGNGGKVLAVNSAANALEFVDQASGGTGSATNVANFRVTFTNTGVFADVVGLPTGWTYTVVTETRISITMPVGSSVKVAQYWALGSDNRYMLNNWVKTIQGAPGCVISYNPASARTFELQAGSATQAGTTNSGHILVQIIL